MQTDAPAHYGNKALSDLRYDLARLAAIASVLECLGRRIGLLLKAHGL